MPAGKASGMLYAFFEVTAECTCVSTDEGADFKKGASWGGIVNQIHGANDYQSSWDWKGCSGNRGHIQSLCTAHPEYEILMSIGGWTLSSHFHSCLKTPEKREKLAESIRVTQSKYGFFKGIDIDWEYPGKFTDSGGERPLTDVHKDTKLWAEFLKVLKTKMPDKYHSAALGMNPELLDKEFATTDFCDVLNDLKYVFTMSYDFYGAWANITGHNAPMTSDPANPLMIPKFSVKESMEVLIGHWNDKCKAKYGALEHKIVLGLGAYGRSWTGASSTEVKPGLPGLYASVPGSGEAIYGPGSITDAAGVGYGAMDFWDIKNKYLNDPGVKRYWDDVAQVPYLLGERNDKVCCLATEHGNSSALCNAADCKHPGKFFISYDDEESIKIKAQYAKSKGFAGLMFWEGSGDREWDLLNAAYEGWGSSIRAPNKYRPVSSVPEFCGPDDEVIPGFDPGTGCYMYDSWWISDSCSDLADQFETKLLRQRHTDRGTCCQDVGNRVGGFGTADQLKAELRAGSASTYLCPGSVVASQGSGCVP
ncbi:MAG: hypothetical protein KVP17_004565 [Porospora cf. gigantea B]|uniref:uncharacterized protein n=1 Tax=Porospora cf. gigantea B TaxID=2853592 RepID=UPI003571D69C|nr:MAG: hypothetical protein KVP17_004565 [Porospora cf. gigantea B]